MKRPPLASISLCMFANCCVGVGDGDKYELHCRLCALHLDSSDNAGIRQADKLVSAYSRSFVQMVLLTKMSFDVESRWVVGFWANPQSAANHRRQHSWQGLLLLLASSCSSNVFMLATKAIQLCFWGNCPSMWIVRCLKSPLNLMWANSSDTFFCIDAWGFNVVRLVTSWSKELPVKSERLFYEKQLAGRKGQILLGNKSFW